MIYLQNHNQIFTDIGKELELSNYNNAEWVVLWNCVGWWEKTLVEKAKRDGKKVAIFQHGVRGSSRHYPPFNEPILGDIYFCWGENDKERLVKQGNDPDKIKVVGTTIFQHLKEKKKHKGINIVFSPDHWDTEIEENLKTRDELRKLKGVNIITKLIDDQDEKSYDNPIKSYRTNINHLNVVADTLAVADLVVAVSDGTFELLAKALDIPIVVMEEWTPKPFGGDIRYSQGYWRYITDSVKKSKLSELNNIIRQQLKNPNELQEERKKIIIKEGGYGLDTIALVKSTLKNK